MSTKYHNISLLPEFVESRNMYYGPDGIWRAREGLETIDEGNFVYGFTASAYSGNRYHYIFRLDFVTPGSTVTCDIYDEDWILLNSSVVARALDLSAPWSHAIVDGQVVINSPGLSTPLYANIGSSPVTAIAVPSTIPDKTTLALLPGLVCNFSDRIVYAFKNQIYINEVFSLLTITNGIGLEGKICDIFQQGAEGNLIIVTTDFVYSLPPDGLAGEAYAGIISKSSHYSALGYKNAASSMGTVFGIAPQGLMNLISGANVQVTIPTRIRKITKCVNAGIGTDFRQSGQIWACQNGYLVGWGPGLPVLHYRVDTGSATWIDDDNYSGPVKGVMNDACGKLTLVYGDGIVQMYGNNQHCTYGLAIYNPMMGVFSYNIREITATVLSDGISNTQSAVRDSLATVPTSATPGAATVGVSLWGTGVTLQDELRSKRTQHARYTDGIMLEVGVKVDGAVSNVQIKTQQQFDRRFTQ